MTPEEMKLLGGSDAAAIAGVHPYKRPIDVWRRVVEGHQTPQTAAMRRGLRLEPVIRDMFQEETNIELLGARNLRSRSLEWARASLDDVARVAGEERVVEYKSANVRQAARYGESDDEVPDEHLCQVQWYLALSGWNVGYLVALLGGDELRTYTLLSDSEFQGLLFEEAKRFWRDYVVTRKPPPADGSDSFSLWLKGRYVDKSPRLVKADAETEGLLSSYRAACEAFEGCKVLRDQLRQRLELAIGDAAGIEGYCGRVSFKKSKDRSTVDWKAVVDELGAPEEIIQKHTRPTPGPRVFRCTWSKTNEH